MSQRVSMWVSLVLLVAIAAMANYLSFRHYKRFDLTSNKVFTLSSRTTQVLAELKDPVDVYVMLGRGEAEFADVDDLLEQYRAASDKISIHRVDPDRQRAEYQLLAQRFGLSAVATDVGLIAPIPVVVSMGDQRRKIERDQLISEDFESLDDLDGPKISIASERVLTGAIAAMSAGKSTKVCVTQGHGEWPLSGTGRRSLHAAVTELDWEHIKVDTIPGLGGADVPEGCDAVFVIGPQRPFSELEVAALLRYVDDGGGLLLALDPLMDKARFVPSGFAEALAARGIDTGPSLVVEKSDRHLLSPNPLESFIVADFEEHRVVEEIARAGGGVAVGIATHVGRQKDSEAVPLMWASDVSYGETNLAALDEVTDPASLVPQDDDIGGPVGLGAAWTSEDKGRLVVIGDSDWLGEAYLQTPQFSNVDLLSSVTGWLADRGELISIAPRTTNARAVLMTEEDLSVVLVRVVGLLPLAALLTGFAVWWARRS